MTGQTLPWLPPVPAGAFERQLAKFAGEWAARWLHGGGALTVELAERPSRHPADWHGCSAAAASGTADALLALGRSCLANRGDPANSRDAEIFANVGLSAIADLGAHLCAIADPGDTSTRLPVEALVNGGESYRLLGTGWSLALSLDSTAQVLVRRRIAGARKRAVLAGIRQALAPEIIELGCHLGRASLSAAELKALAPGDLLVLDRQLTQALPLAVMGRITSGGKATLESATGAHSVRITQPVNLFAESD